MNSKPNIVITGLGVVSPIGVGVADFWDSLMAGKSGISIRPEFAETRFPFKIGGIVQDFNAKQYIKPRKALKVMCRPIQFGVAAAAMAAEQAGLAQSDLNPDRIGTVFGAETFFADPPEVSDVFARCAENGVYDHEKWGGIFNREIQPLWMLKYLPNMVASHISISNDARGPSNSICQGDASAVLAMIEAISLIQRGKVDVAIVGGTGAGTAITSLLYHGSDHLSKNIDNPQSACRPFDADRDGQVAAEGAGALVIETAEHAKARGAKPLCHILGWQRNFFPFGDGFDDALALNMQTALEHAEVAADQVRLYSANGLAEIDADRLEAAAVEKVFDNVLSFAIKANIGNTRPATGAMELVANVLSLQDSTSPPSINYNPDSLGSLSHLCNASSTLDSPYSVKTTFSKSGQLASLVLKAD